MQKPKQQQQQQQHQQQQQQQQQTNGSLAAASFRFMALVKRTHLNCPTAFLALSLRETLKAITLPGGKFSKCTSIE